MDLKSSLCIAHHLINISANSQCPVIISAGLKTASIWQPW